MSNGRLETVKVKLAESRTALRAFLAELTVGQWEVEVYSDGEVWTVSDIVGHVIQAELSMVGLMDAIRQGHPGASEDFDLARYNKSGVKKMRGKMPAELLSDLATSREKLLVFLDTLETGDLDKKGRHGSGHVLSIEGTLDIINWHDTSHMTDIQKAVVVSK